jgi:hypothetical protein
MGTSWSPDGCAVELVIPVFGRTEPSPAASSSATHAPGPVRGGSGPDHGDVIVEADRHHTHPLKRGRQTGGRER